MLNSEPNNIEFIEIELLSDSTFSCGYESVGQVDVEIEHDELGLPMLSGKTLHGLLRDACFSLKKTFDFSDELIENVFGFSKDNNDKCILRMGDARLDEATRKWILYSEEKADACITPEMILDTLSSIRVQTSIDENGVPKEGSLRSSRVANRGLKLKSFLIWDKLPTIEDKRCLAISALAVRHAGWERNRGRGHVKITLNGDLNFTKRIAKGE